MKITLKLFSVLFMISASTTFAEGDGHVYFGLKTGFFSGDITNADIDPPLGFVVGIGQPRFSIELEILQSELEIEGLYNRSSSHDFNTFALYGAYRSEGEIYFKSRLGVLREEIENVEDTGLTFGIGGGVEASDAVLLEVEYTIIEADAKLLSVGINLRL